MEHWFDMFDLLLLRGSSMSVLEEVANGEVQMAVLLAGRVDLIPSSYIGALLFARA